VGATGCDPTDRPIDGLPPQDPDRPGPTEEALVARSVLVTGANSGIGRATAFELARAGYDVVGTARSADKAAGLRDEASAAGLTVRTVLGDVSDAEDCARMVAETEVLTDGGPWALVNNAGYAQAGAIEDVDDAAARAQLEVNLIAPVRLARLVLPGMRRAGGGRIVNISSLAGRVSSPMAGWYAASKHGLEAASDALRIELDSSGIRVILIEPGGFGTGIWGDAKVPAEPADPSYAAAYARTQQATGRLGTLFPDPVWVGRVVRVALASPLPLARYLVGVDAVGSVLGEKLLPTRVTDYVKGLAAGLRRLPLR